MLADRLLGTTFFVFCFMAMSYGQPGIPTLPGKPKPMPVQKSNSKTPVQQVKVKPTVNNATKQTENAIPEITFQAVNIVSNASCKLLIDGEEKTLLSAGIPFAIDLKKGTYLIKAISRDNSADTLNTALTVDLLSAQKTFEIDLKQVSDNRIKAAADLFDEAKKSENQKSPGQIYSTKSFQLYRKAANLGNVESMLALGAIYDNSNGIIYDDDGYPTFVNSMKLAEDLYLKAAALGSVQAIMWLGNYYMGKNYRAIGVNDFTKAMTWYLKAVQLGNAEAMNEIGFMYVYGEGVQRDNRIAMEWFLKAAQSGAQNKNAFYWLGYYYNSGTAGLPVDYGKAMEWYLKSAALGYNIAMYSIGVLYENGSGVQKDRRKAKEWYKKSCDAGYKAACDRVFLGILN